MKEIKDVKVLQIDSAETYSGTIFPRDVMKRAISKAKEKEIPVGYFDDNGNIIDNEIIGHAYNFYIKGDGVYMDAVLYKDLDLGFRIGGSVSLTEKENKAIDAEILYVTVVKND